MQKYFRKVFIYRSLVADVKIAYVNVYYYRIYVCQSHSRFDYVDVRITVA